MGRWAEISGGRSVGRVVVADNEGVGRVFDLDGELLGRARIEHSVGGRRLWCGPIGSDALVVSGDWHGGVSAYDDVLGAVVWRRDDLTRAQLVRGVGTGVVVSTEGGGSWLLDREGRTQARAPWIDGIVCASGSRVLASADDRLTLVDGAGLEIAVEVPIGDAVPVSGASCHDGFVAGTIDGRVVGVAADGSVRFVHRLPPRELARCITALVDDRYVAALTRDTSGTDARVVLFDGDGGVVGTVPAQLPLDLVPFGDGRHFVSIYADRAKVCLLDIVDGRRSALDGTD